MKHIIVAFDNEKISSRIRNILESEGIARCHSCGSSSEIANAMQEYHTPIILCGCPVSDRGREQLFRTLPEEAVILMIGRPQQLKQIPSDIFRLAAPISKLELIASVRMLLQFSHRMSRKLRPTRSGEEQELIEQAKGHLMEQNGMTEQQAHRFLQKTSMDNGVNLVRTALRILEQ